MNFKRIYFIKNKIKFRFMTSIVYYYEQTSSKCVKIKSKKNKNYFLNKPYFGIIMK